MSSDPETPRPEYTTVHEAATMIAAASLPDCRCTFKRGQLVKLCTLCEANAEVIERAMTEAIGTALLAFKARAESAEQQLTAARLGDNHHNAVTCPHCNSSGSLAVLSVADREQALRKAVYSGVIFGDQGSSRSADALADARKLLHLPQEPK